MVKLQLKLKERLTRKAVSGVIALAREIAEGSVEPAVPESSAPELRCFYRIEAANERTAKKAMAELGKLKEVEFVSKPARRTMK